METIRGRTSLELNLDGFKKRLANYSYILLDLGTGDGRYVRSLAEAHPSWFIIGVDSCRENLREHSQAKLRNMLFIIASAQELPWELTGLISHVTINFPWGSLLKSLLAGDPQLISGLQTSSRSMASVELHLNGGALAEAGTTLEAGAELISSNLLQAGWHVRAPVTMDVGALRNFPSTWARRLAHGRDPRALSMSGQIANQPRSLEHLAALHLS